jgi:hypothetical protein
MATDAINNGARHRSASVGSAGARPHHHPPGRLAADLALSPPTPFKPITYTTPPTPPPALAEGYCAARAGQPPSSNPYALGRPTDHEALAMLWDDGYRVAHRHPHGH